MEQFGGVGAEGIGQGEEDLQSGEFGAGLEVDDGLLAQSGEFGDREAAQTSILASILKNQRKGGAAAVGERRLGGDGCLRKPGGHRMLLSESGFSSSSTDSTST